MLNLSALSGSELATFDKFRESIFSDLHVATIGVVTAIDSDNGLLTVKPIISDRVVNNDGSTSWQEYPEIPDTPYCGTVPAVGDSVVLLFLDQDISAWIQYAGTSPSGAPSSQTQEILRSHSISNAIVIANLTGSSNVISAQQYTTINASTTDNGSGVSDALLKFIENREGFRADWYDDKTGTMTIGYGHTGSLPSGFTAPLTEETAEALLKYDLSSYISAVRSTFSGYTLKQNQFDALVTLAYNIGIGGMERSTLVKDIKAGVTNSAKIQKDFTNWSETHINGKLVVLEGLWNRRLAEFRIYSVGDYTSNG